MNKLIKTLFGFFLFFQMSSFAKQLPYDFSDTFYIPIELHIIEEISTKQGFNEGKELRFEVCHNVFYKNKLIAKRGEVVTAKAETKITKGMNGFPAEIIVDRFNFKNIKSTQLIGIYTKTGVNRALWVYPIKWALTPIPFVGSFTNFITGGEAKIKTTDSVVVKYYPNWK